MFIWMDETYSGIHGGFDKNSSGTGTMELEPVFWQENPVMTSKGSDKILDAEPSLNPESKSTNARKLLVERNLGKVCGDNTMKPLRIGVPLKPGFENFVKVSDPCLYCNGTDICSSTKKQNITGYSIDVFEAAMKKLQDPPCYEYCVFDGSYDGLVGSVSSGNLDGAAGDVTITSDRINTVDFTMPYTQSGVALLVRRDRSDPIQWRFLTPLSKELWFATVGFFCFTGFVIWMIERPKNPEYQGSAMGQFSTAAYFAFSTLTFSHGEIVRSPLSRFVVVIWCFLVLVLVQSYTASLSSLLTADRLQPSVKDLNQLLKAGDSVGYQKGSFVHSLLMHRNFTAGKLIPYSSADDYAKALRNGSKNGGVSAIVDEVPYLKAFLSDSRYEEEFEIQDQIFRTPGFGFVFNSCHCQLVNNLSSAILDITGGEASSTIEKEWLGTSTAEDASLTITKADYAPLTLRNFSGLFLVSGLVSSLMLLISIAKLAYARLTGAEDADAVQTAGSTNPATKYHPLENTTDNISVLDHPHPEATNGDHQGGHGSDWSVPEELLNEAIRLERGHNSSASAGECSANAVRDGSAPAQSLKMIEMNIV
ncbi:glutamate receptor 2.8-like isoform X2 [Miscanthus floridulus]